MQARASLKSRRIAAILLGAAIRFTLAGPIVQGWITQPLPSDVHDIGSIQAGLGWVVSADGRLVVRRADPARQEPALIDTPIAVQCVTFGNGRFVAAGTGSVVLTSNDATNWVQHAIAPADDILKAGYGDGVFILMSRLRIWWSTNASTWQLATAPSQVNPWSRPAFGKGVFVGNTGSELLLSTDLGRTWTTRPMGTARGIYSVGFGAGRFVAIGHNKEAWISDDGRDWVKAGSFGLIRTSDIIYGNGIFATVTPGARAFSRDGVEWTTAPSDVWEYALTFDNDRFIARATLPSPPYNHMALSFSSPVIGATLDASGRLRFNGIDGRAHVVQSTTNVVDGPWRNEATLTVSTGEATAAWQTALPSAAPGGRFFRVHVPE